MSTTVAELEDATVGFDLLFTNSLDGAKQRFADGDSVFHLTGTAVCIFLQAALGLETELLASASQALAQVETGAKSRASTAKGQPQSSRFGHALEFDVLRADAAVLTGLTQALGETYLGYVNCLYSLNKAHSQFTKLFKTVFPEGLDKFTNNGSSQLSSARSSTTDVGATAPVAAPRKGVFSRWLTPNVSTDNVANISFDPRLEEFIVSGAAYGYGLFNLVFSLLPARVKSVVGWFGFTADLDQALQALTVAAGRQDVHAVFARLTLMAYFSLQLQMCGWLADEQRIRTQYAALVELSWNKYPGGSLWGLHRAKFLQFSGKLEESAQCLKEALQPNPGRTFVQADIMLLYELSWLQVSRRQYSEAAETFVKLNDLNKWSPAIYHCLAGACYLFSGNRERAKALLEEVPTLLEAKKASGQRPYPMEQWTTRQVAMWTSKWKKRNERESWVDEISINPAHELGLFMNIHSRVDQDTARALIGEWLSLSPSSTVASTIKVPPSDAVYTPPSLTHPDEHASRSLLLGMLHKVTGHPSESRTFLQESARLAKEHDAKWIGLCANYELALLCLAELDHHPVDDGVWKPTLAMSKADTHLDAAMTFSGREVEMSGRVESRINMVRQQMALRKEKLKLEQL